MDVPAWLLGSFAGLLVVATWFAPKAIAAGTTPGARRRRSGAPETLRALVERRLATLLVRDAVVTTDACIFCGSGVEVWDVHLVPRTIRVNDRCATCKTIASVRNRALACGACADGRTKAKAGLYEYFAKRHPHDGDVSDRVPAAAERGYLETARACLGCAGVLDTAPQPASVLAIDAALRPYWQ